ncbi:SpdA protein [Actinomadura cremea]|nr:SpdA protein [Actinomadura cremea]
MGRSFSAVADSGPVVVLAGIAAAGSFTHIRDTATEHGQHGWMSWAIAVCIDLTCVMAAGERQRDKRTGRASGRLSWPTLVLVGGILLSLAANLAQAHPSVWGWITAGTPAGAFLVAVSMLERRRTSGGPANPSAAPADAPPLDSSAVPSPEAASSPVPSSASSSSSSSPWVVWDERPATAAAVPSAPADASPVDGEDGTEPDGTEDERDTSDGGGDAQTAIPVPVDGPADEPAAPLVAFARRVATEHHNAHGRPITRDALRARLGVSNQLASELLRQVHTEATPVA